MTNLFLLNVALNLFDGTDGNGGNMVGITADSGSDHPNGGSVGDATQTSSKANSGGFNGTSSVAEETNTETKLSEKERRAEFKKLVEGDYKDIYESEFQKAFNRRYRGARENEERMQKLNPLVDKLMMRYNIEGNDVEALSQAIDNDHSYWEYAAEEAGMTEEQYVEYIKLKSDSRRLNEMEQARNREAEVQKQLQVWNDAVAEVKAEYPDFDIDTMVDNPTFKSMLQAGVPMKHAYEVVNLTEIKTRAASEASKATEKSVVEGIRAKGSRPRENGISANNGIATSTDISKLELDDIRDAIARARRGETVRFS